MTDYMQYVKEMGIKQRFHVGRVLLVHKAERSVLCVNLFILWCIDWWHQNRALNSRLILVCQSLLPTRVLSTPPVIPFLAIFSLDYQTPHSLFVILLKQCFDAFDKTRWRSVERYRIGCLFVIRVNLNQRGSRSVAYVSITIYVCSRRRLIDRKVHYVHEQNWTWSSSNSMNKSIKTDYNIDLTKPFITNKSSDERKKWLKASRQDYAIIHWEGMT